MNPSKVYFFNCTQTADDNDALTEPPSGNVALMRQVSKRYEPDEDSPPSECTLVPRCRKKTNKPVGGRCCWSDKDECNRKERRPAKGRRRDTIPTWECMGQDG
ncbi:unnamed protein product [Phyllotreta striolata]|uniref:Uncharacterized protein n=1 Tax=Phyllotreta striolata TaxID=444603 RepID=A0A9N9XUU1_PHYSR|nr:unnamed protein product [Phyllotreta striolata]